MYLGDRRLGDTIDFKFTTRQSTGAPTTLAGSPAVACYVGNGTTEITAGITLTVDFDSRTGLNHVRIVASGGNGFATATDVEVVITAGTVNSVSVVGEVVGTFSIENRSAVMPTTAGRTLDVSATGEADANVTQFGGSNGTFSGGRPEVNTSHFGGTAGTFASGRPEVNTSHIGGSTTPVTNLGIVYNTDFAANYNTTLDKWNVNATHIEGTASSAQIRTAVGLSANDLDSQLGLINANASTAAVRADDAATAIGTPADLGTGATIAANAADIYNTVVSVNVNVADVPSLVWSEVSRTITGGTVGAITGLTIASLENMVTRWLGMVQLDGSVYQYTINALENGPGGGGGGSFPGTADEWTTLKTILGIPSSGTTPADPSAGIMDTIRDNVLLVKAVTDALSPRLPGSGTLSTLTAAQVWAHTLSNALTADATVTATATDAAGAASDAATAVSRIGVPSTTLAGDLANVAADVSTANASLDIISTRVLLALPNAGDGEAGGLWILGANAAATTTLTGAAGQPALSLTGGTGNASGVLITGAGVGSGLVAVGGASGGSGIVGTGQGSGHGIRATAGASGDDLSLTNSDAPTLAAAFFDLANGIESGVTLRQALRALAAALGGNVTGGGTAYAAIGNSGTPRLAVVDGGSGNRTVTPSL